MKKADCVCHRYGHRGYVKVFLFFLLCLTINYPSYAADSVPNYNSWPWLSVGIIGAVGAGFIIANSINSADHADEPKKPASSPASSEQHIATDEIEQSIVSKSYVTKISLTENRPQTVPITPFTSSTKNIQQPVIMTSSTNNLLSIAGEQVAGEIIVQNGGDEINKFDIQIIDDEEGLLTVDKKSSCYNSKSITQGGKCKFNLIYNGKSTDEVVRKSILLRVGNNNDYYDTTTINTIDVPYGSWYVPYQDITAASSLNFTKKITAMTNANRYGIAIIYVGNDGEGIAKTTDGGLNWVLVNKGLHDLHITALHHIDKLPRGELYAGTAKGIFKSTDGGETWQEFNNNYIAGKKIVNLYSVKKESDFDLYAMVDEQGIYKTDSTKPNWQKITVAEGDHDIQLTTFNGSSGIYSQNDNNDISSIQIVTEGDNRGWYIGTYGSGIYKNIDNSCDFVEIGEDSISVFRLGVQSLLAVDNGKVIYAGMGGSNYEARGVFKTHDGGKQWSPALPDVRVTTLSSVYSHRINTNIVYAATQAGIFRNFIDNSSDDNWQKYGLDDEYISAITPLEHTNGDIELYAGTDSGRVFKRMAQEGAEWSKLNNDLAKATIQDLHVIEHNSIMTLYAGTKEHGIFRSIDNGANWQQVNTGLTTTTMNIWSLCSEDDGEHGLYALLYGNGGVLKSTDGLTWEKVFAWHELSDDLQIGGHYIVGLEYLKNGEHSGLYAITGSSNTDTGGGVVLRSIDGGRNWSKVAQLDFQPLGLYVVNEGQPSLYVTTKDRDVKNNILIFASDNGKDWKPYSPDTTIKNQEQRLELQEFLLNICSYKHQSSSFFKLRHDKTTNIFHAYTATDGRLYQSAYKKLPEVL